MTSYQPNLDASVYLMFSIKTWKDQGNYVLYVVCCTVVGSTAQHIHHLPSMWGF